MLDGLNEVLERRDLIAAVDLDAAKMNIIAGKTKETSQTKVGDPELGAKLHRLSPLDVQRIQITHGELAFADQTGKGSPSLWLHDLDGTVENLATRRGLSHGAAYSEIPYEREARAAVGLVAAGAPVAEPDAVEGSFEIVDVIVAGERSDHVARLPESRE